MICSYGCGAVGARPEGAQRLELLCCGDRLRGQCSEGVGGSDLFVLAGKLLQKSFFYLLKTFLWQKGLLQVVVEVTGRGLGSSAEPRVHPRDTTFSAVCTSFH